MELWPVSASFISTVEEVSSRRWFPHYLKRYLGAVLGGAEVLDKWGLEPALLEDRTEVRIGARLQQRTDDLRLESAWAFLSFGRELNEMMW